ncbi:MAG TPA: hypothetical protein VI757_15835 [Bacteroidia bacterium]|nr:hypothetical protein [Bacteroidia bacterium]
MDNLEILTKAIQLQKPISFEYNAPKHVVGKRYGNPYAVYIDVGTNNILMDIYRTSGAQTPPIKKPLPDWKRYLVDYLSEIKVLEEENSFEIRHDYKPNSPRYAKSLVKI